MPRRILIVMLAIVGMWAAFAYLVSRILSGIDGNLLGFAGTVVMFYPTADIELRKWLLRSKRRPIDDSAVPVGQGRTASHPARWGRIEDARKAWRAFEKDLNVAAESALSAFSWWHLFAYMAGLTLIAAGFLSTYLAS